MQNSEPTGILQSAAHSAKDSRERAACQQSQLAWHARTYGDFELLAGRRIKDSPYVSQAAKVILSDGTYKKDESGRDILIEVPNTDLRVFLSTSHRIRGYMTVYRSRCFW